MNARKAMIPTYRPAIFIILFLVSISPSVGLASMPFNIEVEQLHSINLKIDDKTNPPIHEEEESNSPITKSLNGNENEKSDCRSPDVRTSEAYGDATVKVEKQEDDLVTLSLSATSRVQGGHYTTRLFPELCIGILPHDTIASAEVGAFARITIRFKPNFPLTAYELQVHSSSEGLAPIIRLKDPTNHEEDVSTNRGSGQPIIIHGRPGAVYYLTARLDSVTSASGEIGNKQMSGKSRMDIAFLPAAQLDAYGSYVPFIAGGNETTSYKNVGAFLIDGRLHCTGTVLGKNTVLTAAHCLYEYEKRLKGFVFILGSNITQPDAGPYQVSQFVYPTGEPEGFTYNPNTLEDDIGLVYLATPVTEEEVILHDGQHPNWNTVLQDKLNLTFVGFGYDVLKGQQIEVGIKREASWHINTIENRKITFALQDKNTCKGDSGGPAFRRVGDQLIQMAITSKGDPECTRGVNTRIDSYSKWLDGKIK